MSYAMTWTFAAVSIVFHVSAYDYIAHWETERSIISKWLGKYSVWFYAVYVFTSNCIRDKLVQNAIQNDLVEFVFVSPLIADLIGYVFIAVGIFLNMWTLKALGIKAMYHGISFGYLLPGGPITGGPFRWFENPQYVGSTMILLGYALLFRSPSGIVLSIIMALTYTVAVYLFEKDHFCRAYNKAVSGHAAMEKQTPPIVWSFLKKLKTSLQKGKLDPTRVAKSL